MTFDRDRGSREPTVEVAHEALLREWPRLRAWLDEDRERLRTLRSVTTASAIWDDGGRDAGDLWRGARLESAREFSEDHPDELNESETAFVEASLAAYEEARAQSARTNRRLRRLAAAVSVIAVVALVAGLVAVIQWRDANDQRDAAEVAAADAAALSDQAIADAGALQRAQRETASALAETESALAAEEGSAAPRADGHSPSDGPHGR